MGKIKAFRNQKYHELRSQAKNAGTLFVDPEFPPEPQSIYQSKPAPSDIIWKRPGVGFALVEVLKAFRSNK